MLTLQIVPYSEIVDLSSLGRIRKLLNIAKENKIVLLQGRLTKEEEAELIKITMEEINKDFKGVELAVIEPTTQTATVKASSLRIRKGPGTSYTKIGSMPNGATVEIISYDSSWSKIKYGNITGYCSTHYLKLN